MSSLHPLDKLTANTAVAQSQQARDMSPVAPLKAVGYLVDDNNDFAFDLYQYLRQHQGGNFFFSPYSISVALAMIYAGARGDTEAQMAQALHFTLGPESLHPAFNVLDLSLYSAEQAVGPGELSLRAANALWAQRDYQFLPAFLEVLGRHYGAGVRLVDYTDDARHEQALQAINDWVSTATEKRIPNVIGPDGLDALTRLILASVIYFKGAWETPFAPNSPQAPFYQLDGRAVEATMMFRGGHIGYSHKLECQALALPYAGGRLAFLLLLPPADQFARFEQSLTSAKVRGIVAGLPAADVKLHMPRFKYNTGLSLAEALAALGMPSAFEQAQADFSGATGHRDLFISDVIHQAYVAVDEKGTEATAATLMGFVGAAQNPPPPIVVRVDHPFIFLIRDQLTGSILFVGRVLDPSDS